jgi:hypothetical protein
MLPAIIVSTAFQLLVVVRTFQLTRVTQLSFSYVNIYKKIRLLRRAFTVYSGELALLQIFKINLFLYN